MSDDGGLAQKIADYIAVAAEFERCQAAADNLRKRLAAAMREIGARDSATERRSFNARNPNEGILATPDAAEIIDTMTGWASARMRLREAYAALPAEARKHVVGLPRDADAR